MHWIFESPLRPTIISLERTGGELLTDLYSLHLKKNLTWFQDGHDAVDYLHREDVKLLTDSLVYDEEGRSRFNIIDERLGQADVLRKQVDKARKQFGSRLFIFDPLSDYLRSLPLDQQEDFFLWEKMMKKEGLVFINILHTRKPPQSKDGEFRMVTEYEILGTGSAVQSADINIVLNRDKMSSDSEIRNTTIVSMPKCRGGTTGVACELLYDTETRQQYDKEDFLNQQSGRQINPNYAEEIQPIQDEYVPPSEYLIEGDVVELNF